MNRTHLLQTCFALAVLTACSDTARKDPANTAKALPAPVYYKVDLNTSGTLFGRIRYSGRKPARKLVDMSGDPACVAAHDGKAYQNSVVVSTSGSMANVFVYIKSGLEGKNFEVPAAPVTIDQKGCWFHPRVLGIQTGQRLEVINSDPVTHNIHPLAQINREWNHSQGQGDAPLERKFLKPEVPIRVKCNIHSWMHAFIGVVSHPYFAVTGPDGTFEIRNVPPGDYIIEAWQERLGTQEEKVTVAPSAKIENNFTFKGE